METDREREGRTEGGGRGYIGEGGCMEGWREGRIDS